MEEGIQKIAAGRSRPTCSSRPRGTSAGSSSQNLVQPLQHELIPNMEANVWPSYSNPGPYYDLGWRYTVPYTIYTWGVAYRRDLVDDDAAAEQGWDALWNSEYAGKISLYDSYGDTIAVAIMRNGSLDVNTGDPALIDAAKEAILQTINENEARLTINGVYAKLPAGEFTVAEAWSGDIVGAQWYLPEGRRHRRARLLAAADGSDDDRQRPAGRSRRWRRTRASPTSSSTSSSTRSTGTDNFVNWNGYQPPFTTIDPDKLIDNGVVPANLADGGRDRGHVQGGPHADRAGAGRGPDVARRLDRDHGGGVTSHR